MKATGQTEVETCSCELSSNNPPPMTGKRGRKDCTNRAGFSDQGFNLPHFSDCVRV